MYESDKVNLVHSFWNDTSQDPDFISQQTGIDLSIVLEILEHLEKKGKIKNFKLDETKIILFNEMINVEDYFNLNLDKISTKKDDENYFFYDTKVDKTFTKGPFTINVRWKHFIQDHIILDLDVSYLDETYPILLYYDIDDNVFFLSPGDPQILDIFIEELGHNLDKFYKFSEEVLNKIIPHDFWETRSKFN